MIIIPSHILYGTLVDDKIIKWINERLAKMMERIMQECANDNEVLVLDDELPKMVLSKYLPCDWPLDECSRQFCELYFLIKDGERYVRPSLQQVYILVKIIKEFLKRADSANLPAVKKMPRQIRSEFIEEVSLILETERKKGYVLGKWAKTAEEAVEYYEDLRLYWDTVFNEGDWVLVDMIIKKEKSSGTIERFEQSRYSRILEQDHHYLNGVKKIPLPRMEKLNEWRYLKRR